MVRAFEPKNITSSFLELPEIEPSRAELLKTCGSRAKFRAEPRLDTPLIHSEKMSLIRNKYENCIYAHVFVMKYRWKNLKCVSCMYLFANHNMLQRLTLIFSILKYWGENLNSFSQMKRVKNAQKKTTIQVQNSFIYRSLELN